jgi:phenylacetate-CoA ligase
MKDVVGRCADAFVDADGNFIVALSMQVYLIEKGPDVGQVQVIQNSLTDVTVRMTPDPKPDKKVKDYYTKTIKKVVKGTQRVHFEIVDRIKTEKSGKYRFTICKIPQREIEKIKAKVKLRR